MALVRSLPPGFRRAIPHRGNHVQGVEQGTSKFHRNRHDRRGSCIALNAAAPYGIKCTDVRAYEDTEALDDHMLSETYPDLKGTIFIVTYGRSGSTVMQSLLQSIPRAHITGENNLALEGLFQAARRVRKSRQTWGKKRQAPTHPWYGADQLDPDRFDRRLAELFVEDVLQPPKEARWIGFKEIRYPRLGNDFGPYLQFCRRSFPNAFFVFNSRNGEDVSKSKWWARKPREEVLQMVKTMDARFARFTANNPEIACHAFHEQTCTDPTSLQPLFDKLGETLDLNVANRIMKRKLIH